MKLKVVEIEATADELKASNNLADSFSNQLRNLFSSPFHANFADFADDDEDDDEEEDEEEDDEDARS